MTRRVARRSAVLAVLALLLGPLLLLGGQTGASAAGDGSVTKSGSGRFSNLKVTVSQVDHLRNQVVRVSWSGGQQSATSGRNFFNNYLQIMQCWGDEATPQREKCQYGGVFDDQRGGQATSNREIVNNGQLDDPAETKYTAPFPATAVVPFQSVTGKSTTDRRNEFYDSQSTNEIDYGRTSADGTGEEFFELQTGREASGLGCGVPEDDGTPRKCWLVVVPRDDREVNGQDVDDLPGARLETSPLSTSNFANAISFRLDFDRVGVTCPIGSAERRVIGNEEISEAVSLWQPALCDTTGSIFGYSQIGDDTARNQALTDDPWLSLVNRPLAADRNTDGRLLTYAPVAVSGIGIGVVIERTPKDGPRNEETNTGSTDAEKAKRGTRVLELRLNARLVAKLLTQSYTAAVTGSTKQVTGNPRWLAEDKEFLTLNPEFNQLQYIGNLYSITNPLGLTDANRAVWEWIKADPDARAFMAGKKDPWGTHVNTFYKNLDLDRMDFPRADPECVKFVSDQAPLCALDHLAYANDFHAAARGAIRGLTLQNDTWDLAAIPPRYKASPAQAPGERAVLAFVDTATAARFKLTLASLKNGKGQYVAPTKAALAAGLGAMSDGPVAGVLESNPGSKASGAYPLTEVTYAMTAPRQLDADEAKDYAGFIRYVTGAGQVPGIAPGQLPEGYLPLPAKLRAQAEDAAALVAKRGGPAPSTGDGDGPAGTPADGAEEPTAATPPPPGELPQAAGGPSVENPVTTPEVLTPSASDTEALEPATFARYALAVAALLGVLVALSRPAVAGLGSLRRMRAAAAAASPQSPR